MKTPVIVGVGQSVYRGAPLSTPELSPVGLAATAGLRMLADAGLNPAQAQQIDVVAGIRLMAESIPGAPMPFGKAANYPRAVAARLGINPSRALYSTVGGQNPQRLINELSVDIARGRHTAAIIVGSEANGLLKSATRAGIALDWLDETEGDLEDRGFGSALSNRAEQTHELYAPVIVYALIEHALRARLGRSREQHVKHMAAMLATFSLVASQNPFAQFPELHTVDFLATPSTDNYRLTDPFTKWLIAQDAVNQGAAVLITSNEQADAWGIPSNRRMYIHGFGDADDLPLSERPHMDSSVALNLATQQALEAAGITISDIANLDLYSCFPCAVSLACEALDIDSENDKRPLTVTGGLPFFGGAGNAYSLNAIAAMVYRLRADPNSLGLVSANGGYMSKQSVGIYGSQLPARTWQASLSVVNMKERGNALNVSAMPTGAGRIETFTTTWKNDQPVAGVAIGRMSATGQRFIARAQVGDSETLMAMENTDPIGRSVIVEPHEAGNIFRFKG